MDITILDKTENTIKFIVEGVDVSFANALRRIIISEVPTLAIDTIYVLENTSVMFDEMLAHRLGLIPLKTDLESYVKPEECECGGKGCPMCQVTLTLEVEAFDGPMIVYSKDIVSQDPKVYPVSGDIPIVKLEKGQKIILELNARLGTGKEHAKFQPVATASYKYVPIVEIERDKCTLCGECMNVCPRNIFEITESEIGINNTLDCTLCNLCVEACETNAIYVDWDDNRFIFTIESTGALAPEEIVKKAAQILLEKAESALESIS